MQVKERIKIFETGKYWIGTVRGIQFLEKVVFQWCFQKRFFHIAGLYNMFIKQASTRHLRRKAQRKVVGF